MNAHDSIPIGDMLKVVGLFSHIEISNRIALIMIDTQADRQRYMLMRVTRASHVEQWLPETSKTDAVDGDKLISLNILANVWLIDRSCEGVVSHRCD